MKSSFPDQISVYFWGDNLEELNWSKHKKYIIQTLLEKGNPEALRWLFQHATKLELRNVLPELTLQPKSSNFWQIYLS